MMKRTIDLTLLVLLSAVFMISALGKLMDMDGFETTLNYYGLGIDTSAVVARLVVSLEFFLSVAILFPWKRSRFLMALTGLIGVLTIMLIWFAFRYPEAEDCGCHGQIISLNPKLSILKNFVLIGLAVFLVKRQDSLSNHLRKWQFWMFSGLAVLALGATVVVSPPDFIYRDGQALSLPHSFESEEVLFALRFSDGTAMTDMSEERFYLLFAQPGCRFCKMLTSRLNALSESGQITKPLYVVFPEGAETIVEEYWAETKSAPRPFAIINDFEQYLNLSGPKLPALYLMEGNQFRAKFAYRDLNVRLLKEFESMP
jgi:uncharacterized membrane protein YphA (DoxX/SURF4 family)